MDQKFEDKRVTTNGRAPFWNYALASPYFITFVTKGRLKCLSQIEPLPGGKCEVILTQAGKILEQEWLVTPAKRASMNIEFGAYVIMPDHFHAIVMIHPNEHNSSDLPRANTVGSQTHNLPDLLRGVKSSSSKRIREFMPEFRWEKGYHDRIIRDHGEFDRIRYYILNNPMKWIYTK
jgi:putative transposase